MNMKKNLIKWLILSLFSPLVLSALPATALGYYTLSESKVVAETVIPTTSKILKVGEKAALVLPDIPGWYPADNTHYRVAEMDLVKSLAVFTGLQEGITAARLCNDYTTQCVTIAITVTNDEAYAQGQLKFKNGQLVAQGKTVYIIYKNTKTPFTNYQAFKDMGFRDSQITFRGDLSAVPDTGYMIENSQSWHPWGSWIKKGNQVYFVHELGLMPVADMQTFALSGGSAAMLVAMNKADEELSILPPMKLVDIRLK